MLFLVSAACRSFRRLIRFGLGCSSAARREWFDFVFSRSVKNFNFFTDSARFSVFTASLLVLYLKTLADRWSRNPGIRFSDFESRKNKATPHKNGSRKFPVVKATKKKIQLELLLVLAAGFFRLRLYLGSERSEIKNLLLFHRLRHCVFFLFVI